MTFQVANSTDPGDGRRRREPPRISLAGEVLKKKLQLKSNAVPPPALPRAFNSNTSRFDMRQEEEDEEDYQYTLDKDPNQRPSNTIGSSNQDISSSAVVLTKKSGEPKVYSVSELVTVIKTQLRLHPQLKPYVQYALPLERKGDGQLELPILPIFHKDSCELCLEHGNTCIVDFEDSNSKCTACTQFGDRCIFINLEGVTPRKSELHFNCSRCVRGLKSNFEHSVTPVKLPFSPGKFLSQINRRIRDSSDNIVHLSNDDYEVHSSHLTWSLNVDSLMHSGAQDQEAEFNKSTSMQSMASNQIANCNENQSTERSGSDENSSDTPSISSESLAFSQLGETSSSSSTQELESVTGDDHDQGQNVNAKSLSLGATAKEVLHGKASIQSSIQLEKLNITESITGTGLGSVITPDLTTTLPERPSLPQSMESRVVPSSEQAKKHEGRIKKPPSRRFKSTRLESLYNQPQSQLFQAAQFPQRYTAELNIRHARKKFRQGFEEAQGGEFIARRETLVDNYEDKEEAHELRDEELSTEEFWKRKFEENIDSIGGSFWELEPRRHR